MENKQLFKSSTIIDYAAIELAKDFFEKEAVIGFLSQLPLDYLKRLTNFKYITFMNKDRIEQSIEL